MVGVGQYDAFFSTHVTSSIRANLLYEEPYQMYAVMLGTSGTRHRYLYLFHVLL